MPIPKTCRNQPRKCISVKHEMDHFHRNFEDLQNTLKLFSTEKPELGNPQAR